jgi:hypothetical protein
MTVKFKQTVRLVIHLHSYVIGARIFPQQTEEVVTQNFHNLVAKLVIHVLRMTVPRDQLAPHVIWEDVNGALNRKDVFLRIAGNVPYHQIVCRMMIANVQSQSLLAMRTKSQTGLFGQWYRFMF